MDRLKKLLHIFKSPALSAVVHWAGCVKWRLLATCALSIACILCSLGMTLTTRTLIDSAVSSKADMLWRAGVLLAVLMLTERLLRVFAAALRIGTSTRVQKTLQGQMMNELLTREYAGLKRYHSGELVSRVFSDVAVVKNGIVSMLPSICSMLVSFVGAVIILA